MPVNIRRSFVPAHTGAFPLLDRRAARFLPGAIAVALVAASAQGARPPGGPVALAAGVGWCISVASR